MGRVMWGVEVSNSEIKINKNKNYNNSIIRRLDKDIPLLLIIITHQKDK